MEVKTKSGIHNKLNLAQLNDNENPPVLIPFSLDNSPVQFLDPSNTSAMNYKKGRILVYKKSDRELDGNQKAV